MADDADLLAEQRAYCGARPPDYDEWWQCRTSSFDWRPEQQYDVVFFSFWLSHVPRARFGEFWSLVRDCLAPGGRAFLIDNRADPQPASSAKDPYVLEYEPDLHRRRLADGSEWRVVKVMYEPDELAGLLEREGWRSQIDGTRWFLYGAAEPWPSHRSISTSCSG